MYYLHTLKNCNKARDTAKNYITKDDLVKLDHIAWIVYNHRNRLFPESSHKVWLDEENFDCVVASLYIDPNIPKDVSIPIMAYEISESIGQCNYDSLVKITNHPYSVPLSVLVYVTINALLENDYVLGYRKDFYQLSADYLSRNLKIDPFYIIQWESFVWKPEKF